MYRGVARTLQDPRAASHCTSASSCGPDSNFTAPEGRFSAEKEINMPILFIEAPPGIHPEAKKKMVEKITAAVDEAYHMGDTLISSANTRLRTYPWMAASSRKIPKSWKP
jgi:phenylpyruvate tautomerase PptA (4-oxalocrotonate tautomerase family)